MLSTMVLAPSKGIHLAVLIQIDRIQRYHSGIVLIRVDCSLRRYRGMTYRDAWYVLTGRV